MKDRKAHKKAQAERKEAKRIKKVRTLLPLTVIGAEYQKCGECQACCHVIAVHDSPDGNKPNYVKCSKQCESGCSIYSTRPVSCRTYGCLWYGGFVTGGVEMRPDKFGLIIEQRIDSGGRDVLVLWETRPGAMEEPQVKAWVQRVKEKTTLRLRWNPYGFNLDENGNPDPDEKPETVKPIPIVRPLFGIL